MKIPKRINEIIARKDKYLDQAIVSLDKKVIQAQTILLDRVIKDIVPKLELANGQIKNTLKNYQLLQTLDRLYRDFQKNNLLYFNPEFAKSTKTILSVNNDFFKISLGVELPGIFKQITEEVTNRVNARVGLKGGKIISGGFLEGLVKDEPTLSKLKAFLGKAITARLSQKDFLAGINKIITGAGVQTGGLQRQFRNLASDLYMQYDAAYNLSIADRLKLNYFIYVGGLVGDSRDFCICHDGKVWSREEAKGWTTWKPKDCILPVKMKLDEKANVTPGYLGYEGYDPLIDRGGYNCRHHLSWITDKLAMKMRPDLKDEK